MIGPEILWPQTSNDLNHPEWPKLLSYRMTYAAATSSGTWHFERSTYCREYVFDRDPDLLPYEEPMNAAPQDEYPDDYRSQPSPILNDLYVAATHTSP
ncbi:hypothetical protein BDV19DRAFT_386662 [Aspergillus venezuelensis]